MNEALSAIEEKLRVIYGHALEGSVSVVRREIKELIDYVVRKIEEEKDGGDDNSA